jgi:uncharacterized protein (TIGR00369 family)
MEIAEIFDRMPFGDLLGIEVREIGDGSAVGELELSVEHSSTPETLVTHGGVTYALADTVGGAAVISASGTVAPTIDMRIDYLSPATGGVLRAEAEVVRNGSDVAAVEVKITDEDGAAIATAHGTYKSGGVGDGSAWLGEESIE